MVHDIQISPKEKKVYFASDFHLGTPDAATSLEREKKIVSWLDSIKSDAYCIFLLGDIFDFWFEYKHVIPKGYIRLQAKLLEITEAGIPVTFFTGNHDMWMFDYFPRELHVRVFDKPQVFVINGVRFLVGHGDGLGPGDPVFKVIRKFFRSPVCQWMFSWLHPNVGMAIANYWSMSSRTKNIKKGEDQFMGEEEWIYQHCKQVEAKEHFDYYIFGHRHLPLNMQVGSTARYINLGEWLHYFTYGVFDGQQFILHKFEK